MPEWKPEIRRRLAGLQLSPPNWKEEIRQRLAILSLLGLAPAREGEIVEELAQHLEDCFDELRASGSTQEEASSAVLAELSDSDLLRHELLRVERRTPIDRI